MGTGKVVKEQRRANVAYAASPVPTPARASNIWTKFRAIPPAAVAMLHAPTPIARRRVREMRSPRKKGEVAK